MTPRYALTLLSLFVAAVPALAQNAAPKPAAAATGTSPAQDLASPEATVRSFIDAINGLDPDGANCLVGGKVDQNLRAWTEYARKSPDKLRVTVVSATPQISGESATVVATVQLSILPNQQFEETLSLRHAGNEWKIVPPTEAELDALSKPGDKNPHVIATLSVIYTQPKKAMAQQHTTAENVVCLSRVKQLATATFVFMEDNDEKFPSKANAYVTAVRPYVKSDEPFHCPSAGDAAVAYSMNPQLQGRLRTTVRKPELTILIYEGSKGVLSFRHKGRATVALVTGKVVQVTPVEAKRLRWVP